MAPSNFPFYQKDEKVLCFHHEFLYEAKVLDYKHMDENDKKSPYQYRVHYKGWKNTWDDWVPQDRIRKFTEENKELAANLKAEMEKMLNPPKLKVAPAKKKAAGSDLSSTRGSEERLTPVGRGQKRGRDYEIEKVRERPDSPFGFRFDIPQFKPLRKSNEKMNKFTDNKPWLEQEETFHQRPAIHIPVSDRLKALLVDDWEYVTKNLSLIPLPAKHPVNEIIDAYFEEEKGKRRLGSAEASILEEVISGTKEYFEKSLGKILLYRFERQQYFEARRKLEAGRGEWENKAIGDIYGAEHLARLFVSLPELIAQTNMDEKSVRKLRDEIIKMTTWLGKNSKRYFAAEYEAATPAYIEKARGD